VILPGIQASPGRSKGHHPFGQQLTINRRWPTENNRLGLCRLSTVRVSLARLNEWHAADGSPSISISS